LALQIELVGNLRNKQRIVFKTLLIVVKILKSQPLTNNKKSFFGLKLVQKVFFTKFWAWPIMHDGDKYF